MAKTAATTTSPKGGALVSWEAQLLKRTEIAKATEDSVQLGQFFGTKAGVLSFAGSPIPGNKINVVILDHVLENKLYDGEYDADSPRPPICYAFARTDKELKPHEKSAKPQCETCKGCPMNEFGTSDRGKGKACKNSRRLCLLPADALKSPDAVRDTQAGYINIPVTSVKGYAAYVKQITEVLRKPPCLVVTELSLHPDPKSQFKMVFTLKEELRLDAKLGTALMSRVEQAEREIIFPYPEADLSDPRARPSQKKTAKKPARRY